MSYTRIHNDFFISFLTPSIRIIELEEQCAALEEEHAVLEEQRAEFERECQQAKMQEAQVESKLFRQKQVKLESTLRDGIS